MSEKQSKWVCIYKTSSRFDAQAAQGNLESSDIPCVMLNKQDSSYMAFGYVPEEYKVIAENLLNNNLQQN
jgi:hypothetical protein